jgi:geranylgeranyl diphosphate synthase type I
LDIDFRSELSARRDQVYAYLDGWGGIESFRPAHMREAILSYVRRRGKGLRPALLMLSCGAVGGNEEQAVPAAAAVEVFQIWTLVHDDIIDRDRTRRGHPTVHARFADIGEAEIGLSQGEAAHYGTSVGILAGDLQQSWCYALLCDLERRGVPATLIVELVGRMASSLTPQLMEGEMLDVQFSLRSRDLLSDAVSDLGTTLPGGAEVLDMLEKKTGTLLEYAAWAGARIGLARNGEDPSQAERLGQFARLCGRGFQLHDDLLGLTADERVLGKPVGSDLREGKLTYIVSRGLELASAEQRNILGSVLGNSEATPSQIDTAVEVLRATGALQNTAELAQTFIEQALALLDALPPSNQRELLRAWAVYLLARQY